MKSATLPLLLSICSLTTTAQQDPQPNSKRLLAPQVMCDAAASKLREAGANEVVLRMEVDTSGRVQAFTTESPKGLRLENMKDPSVAIKAMKFDPAKKKDGRPVAVMIRVEFECSQPPTDDPKKQ